ncbi:hypothetical protein DIPPA_24155 [Diplonema papillatum]|nr:hypothetical protein DIPPA_24155 [Diplonema papillatum]
MRSLVQAFQGNPSDVQAVAGFSQAAADALYKTRQSHVVMGELLKAVSLARAQPGGKHGERALLSFAEKAAASAVDAAASLGESNSVASLMEAAATCVKDAAQFALDGKWDKAEGAAREAWKTSERACCTGVSSAAATARKLAASCAELRGKAASAAGPEDIRALANTVAQISREASFAAQASLPHAVVTTGLEQCAQLLEAVVDQFRSGVITKDATERAGKAGAAAWGAAEAHAGVRKAMDFCQAATDQLHKGSEAAAGSALTGAMQALGAVEGSAPHPGIASAFRACRERLAQVRVTAGSAPSAAAVQRVYRQLSVAAGDPGAEEATARYIAERLNELLRGLSASQPLPGLLSVVQATMTDAADIMGCDPANPTPNNAPALAFSKELEYAAQVGDPAKVAELVATAQRLSATSGGIVAAAMAQVAERLSGGAPVDDAAALCRTALGAAKSGHDAVRMLKEALGAETLDPQRLKVVSGEVSLLSEGLGGDTEQRLTALSKAVLQLADAPETAETRFELQDALADLSVLAGTATKQDTIAQAFEQVASMVAEYLDQDEKSGNRVPIPFVLKLRLRRLRENAPEYAGWYACLDRVVSLREQQDTDHAKRQAEQRERAQGEAREKQSKRAELLDSLKLQSRHTRATLEALSLPERLEGAATAELRAELYSATLSGLPEQSLMASVLRDAMLAAEPEESVVTSGAGAAVQLADIHTTLTGYRELIRMGETLGAAEAAQLQDLSAQFAATAGALQGDASKAAALRLARDLGQVATGVTQGNPAAAAELLALHDSFSAAVGTAKAPFAGADAAAEAGPGSRRGSAGVDALVAGLDDMVASVQRGAKVDPTALAGLQRLAREATARDPAHAALGEKVSSFCENLLLQQQQQLVQQQGQQLQVQQQGQPAQEPAGGAVAVPLRALAALTADAHAAASEKMDRAQQLLREADLGHVDMADAILAYIEMHRRNHARNPANAADDAAKREAWEQDMSDVVAKLRGGDSSIAEQVDEALGRLRSSSLSMTALAAEATEMFERKDFAGLAGVLETAVILQREVGKGTELPPLDETRCRLPKLATVLTAVASLKKKVESPSGYDSAALLEELQVVQSMALAAGGMGPGLAERACGGLRGAPATKEGAELCNEAAQRHRIPQLSMAARCLADGDAAAAAAAAEPVQQTLHLARKVAAKCKDLAWAISTGAPSASLPSLLHPLSNSTRQLCAKLDILELPYPKPAIEDLLAKLEAPQDPPDGRTTLNHLSALSDLLEQTAQAGTHSAALSLNRIALSLDAIAAGIKPAPKDAPHAGLPAKTTASLLAVRAELKALAETVSDKSVLHAAATTAIAGYLPLLSGGDEAACIKRFAGRLRHAVDLQRDVGAAAAAAETGVRRFLAHDAAGGLAMIKQAYDSVGERLRAFDDGFVEDLKEMATSTGQDTPVVLLAGEADFIVERLTAWAGTPLPEHTAARLVASRLDDLAATLKGDTPAGGAHALQAMVETALVVAGPAPSPGEARTAALRDALAEKAAREAGGDEAAAEAYSDALAQVAALGDAAGGVGAAMRAVRAELDARPGCGKAELAECRALVESVGFATQRVRGVAGRLRGLAHRAAGAVTSDGLTLLSGVCLSVVACLPGESGGDVVALAEDLGALAGRVGSGGVDTAVELAPVCEQALRIAGLLGGLQTETDGLFAQTAAGQAEADAVLGALRAAVDSGAVTLGSVAALAAPADAPPAGFGAAFAGFAADFSAFHPPGAPPPAAGDPTQCLLALRVVEAAKRVGGGEAGTAAGAMARALASRYLAHAGEPSLAESLRAVLPVLPAGDVRSALAGNLEAVEKLAEKLSGASEMAALAEGVSGGVKDALHLVVETAKAGGPVEAVIRAAELALAAGCDAPLVQSFAADVRQAHEQLALSALQAARRRDTPSHARHALHNAAAPAIIQAKLPPFREVSAGVPQGSFSSGGEICCKLQQNEGQGGADEAAVADVLQLVRVDDEDYIQVVEQTVRDLEGSVKELKALATERGADESEREAALLQLRDELAGARGEASRISDKMEDLERAVDLRNGRIAELEDACSSLESQLQDLERDAAGHTEASALARADLETSAQIVAQKDAELAELRESLGKATKQFEERSTRDRGTMEVVLHSATLTTELRGSVEKSYEKGLEEDATRVLREMYESQNLPPDVHERVERVLEREGALEEKVEVIKQGFAPSVGVELRSRACSVVRAVEGLDADSGGLGSIAGVAWELAQDVRRGDADAPALEETIRKLAERFAAEKSPVAAALAQEAVRRVHDGDHHAASAILQQASTTAAQHSAHHVPVHPRLAKLFADLSTLHRKLSLGTPVSTAQIIKLRSRALELAALGSSPAESCLQYFHDAAGTFNPPPDLFPGLARAAAAAAPHHPEIALLLQEYADALEGAGGGAAAAKGLEAKLQGYEQAKLLFVRVSELSRRVCLGEVGAAVVKGVEDALEGAHEVIGVLEKEADGGDGQAGLALCEESLRKAVENLRRGDPAAAELAAAVSCVGSFVTHGVTPAVVHARSLAALCKTLLDPTAHPEPHARTQHALLLSHQLSKLSYSLPAKSILSCALQDAAAKLEHAQDPAAADLLNQAITAQEKLDRAGQKVGQAAALLKDDDPDDEDGESEDPPPDREAVKLLLHAKEALEAAKLTAGEARLDAEFATLSRAECALDGLIARFDGGSRPFPSRSDVMTILNTDLLPALGHAGGDEAAAQLIAERLTNLLDRLRQGEAETTAAGVLSQFPSPESMAAATQTFAEADPAAARKIGFSALIETTESVRPPSPTDTATSMQTDAMQQGGGAGGSHHQSPPDIGLSAAECVALAMGRSLLELRRELESEGKTERMVEEIGRVYRELDAKARTLPAGSVCRAVLEDVRAALEGAMVAHDDNAQEDAEADGDQQPKTGHKTLVDTLKRARDDCIAGADTSKVARRMARGLWGLESKIASEGRVGEEDWSRLRQVAEKGLRGVKGEQGPKRLLAEWAAEIDGTAASAVTAASVGRLCDAAALAAGLPVRGATGTAADLFDKISLLCERGPPPTLTDLQLLGQQAAAAATRHPEIDAFGSFSDELAAAVAAAQTAQRSPADSAGDISREILQPFLNKAGELRAELERPRGQDVAVQWPDAEGLMQEEESVQKLRTTLGKQMQEEMGKLNARWKKKLAEAEAAKQEIDFEMAAVAEVLAETEIERDTLADRVEELEAEIKALNADVDAGIDDILADRELSIKQQDELLQASRGDVLETGEALERFDIELEEQESRTVHSHTARNRVMDQWKRLRQELNESVDQWTAEEANFQTRLKEAGDAAEILEGAVSRREDEARRLQIEIEEVLKVVSDDRDEHEREMLDLQRQLRDQAEALAIFEAGGSADDAADTLATSFKTELDAAQAARAAAEKKLKEAQHAAKALREELRVSAEASVDLRGKLQSTAAKLEAAEAALQDEKRAKSAVEAELAAVPSVPAAPAKDEQPAADGAKVAALEEEKARLEKALAELEKAHASLEEEAAEALERADVEATRLKADLHEAQEMIAELSDALETS